MSDAGASRTRSVLTLNERLAASSSSPGAGGGGDGASVLSFDQHWQKPAATEKLAFEAMRAAPPQDHAYLGYAWATIIDGVRGGSAKASEILVVLRALPPRAPNERRATIAQHIHALAFADLFAACGVTDLFWSHATYEVQEVRGMRVHPFPLYPAQAPERAEALSADQREHLVNFVGAYNPKNYLSDVRERIFALEGTARDLHVVRRDAWHFDRAVYQEQVGGLSASEEERRVEARRREEYLDAIRRSWFTLCPTGSGPNSIRLFESLALGSIPILLTEALRLPGDAALWARAAIIAPDDADGLRVAIERARDTSTGEREAMIEAGAALFDQVGPSGYRGLIEAGMAGAARPTQGR